MFLCARLQLATLQLCTARSIRDRAIARREQRPSSLVTANDVHFRSAALTVKLVPRKVRRMTCRIATLMGKISSRFTARNRFLLLTFLRRPFSFVRFSVSRRQSCHFHCIKSRKNGALKSLRYAFAYLKQSIFSFVHKLINLIALKPFRSVRNPHHFCSPLHSIKIHLAGAFATESCIEKQLIESSQITIDIKVNAIR